MECLVYHLTFPKVHYNQHPLFVATWWIISTAIKVDFDCPLLCECIPICRFLNFRVRKTQLVYFCFLNKVIVYILFLINSRSVMFGGKYCETICTIIVFKFLTFNKRINGVIAKFYVTASRYFSHANTMSVRFITLD